MNNQEPKGILIPVGGAEDKGTDLELGIISRNNLNFMEIGILKNIVNEIGNNDARIEVITTASQIPDEVSENYIDAYGRFNILANAINVFTQVLMPQISAD